MPRVVLVTGATGQDGSYACEQQLYKGNLVIALVRNNSQKTLGNISHIKHPNLFIEPGDITDKASINEIFKKYTPIDRIFHFAAQSFVGDSWRTPIQMIEVNTVGTLNILDSARFLSPTSRIYVACTSEMVGTLVSYNSPYAFYPRSPYGTSKLAAFWLGRNYVDSYGMYIVHGILYNHSSERRGPHFLTRKISKMVAENYVRLLRGDDQHLCIPFGYLGAKRDIGYAPEYVAAMDMMLDHNTPQDYVLGTGVSYSVKEMISHAFAHKGIKHEWDGEDLEEKCYITSAYGTSDKQFSRYPAVVVNPDLYRKAEVPLLIGDHSLLEKTFGWKPKLTGLQVIERMVDNDIRLLSETQTSA